MLADPSVFETDLGGSKPRRIPDLGPAEKIVMPRRDYGTANSCLVH